MVKANVGTIGHIDHNRNPITSAVVTTTKEEKAKARLQRKRLKELVHRQNRINKITIK